MGCLDCEYKLPTQGVTMPETDLRYDPFDPVVQDDPYPVYAELRATRPVYWCAPRNCWVLSRYEDVSAALQDPTTFSSARGIFPAQGFDLAGAFLPMMIMMDPPRHDLLRRVVAKAFTPRRIALLETPVQQMAAELTERLVTAGGGDVVRELSGPLPAMVIADLLGVPREDRDQFKAWSTALVTTDISAPDPMRSNLDAAAALYEYFRQFLDERRARPRPDLMSALVTAEVEGRRLSEDELLGFCLLLLVAGHETTTNLISNTIAVLAERPEVIDRLARDRSLLPSAVGEMLRYDSPVQGLSRTLTRDVLLHDVQMRSGDTVLLLFGSANRDDSAFPDADHFHIDRVVDRQLAFGRGIHFCLGAALAQLETRLVFDELLSRTHAWRLDTGAAPVRLRSGPIRGYGSLTISI
jgi:cytochrome P450